MNLVAINGSPKKSQGATARILETVKEITGTEVEVHHAMDFMLPSDTHHREAMDRILEADVLLIVFPLYYDALPMALLKLLQQVEGEAKGREPLPRVYAICQCGFYEASHTQTALKIVENFCSRSGLPWQYGLGIGAGELLGRFEKIDSAMTKKVYRALYSLCKDMEEANNEKKDNTFAMPSMPRFLYQFGGSMGWKQQAKDNHVTGQLDATPFSDR